MTMPSTSEPHSIAAQTRTACVIALSNVPNDPRVRRQCEALFDAGWNVVAVGIPGAEDSSLRWPVRVRADDGIGGGAVTESQAIQPASPVNEPAQRGALKELVRRVVGERNWQILSKIRHRVEARPAALVKLYLKPGFAESIFWSWPNIQQLAEAAGSVKADLWLANDWTALPIAARMAERTGGVYVYDSHEFAVDEYAQRLRWRLINRPIVREVERRYIANAKVVSTVSSGIADALEKLYALPEKPTVIRNAPQFSVSRFRPTEDAIRLLYHGIVAPGRGLEEAIASVYLWKPEYSLYIRGPGEAYYLQSLRDQIRALHLEQRVFMLPPVPMIDLVPTAREFDVGFFALKGHSLQNHYVLPNKFFEYTMAGLALCVSDLPEMTRLCERYRHGVVFRGLEKTVIADTVNGLTREVVDRMKQNSIAASHDLCWEKESDRMLKLYNEALTG